MARERDYALILSDVAVPGLDARGLWRTLQAEMPQLAGRVDFVTGDTAGPAARAFLAETGRPRLEKPIVPAELRRLVAELLSDAAV